MNKKLAHALHYLIWLSGVSNWNMEAAKLANSIVMSEATSFRNRQRPLTGAKIVKAPRGPIPDKYYEHLRWLEREGLINIFGAAQLCKSLSRPDLSAFEDRDLAIMADMAESCSKKYTSADLSNPFRDDIWETLGIGDEIPLTACLPGKIVPGNPEPLEKSRQELKNMGC